MNRKKYILFLGIPVLLLLGAISLYQFYFAELWAYEKAMEADYPAGPRGFLVDYPESHYQQEVQDHYETLLFSALKEDFHESPYEHVDELKDFIEDFPNGKHFHEADTLLATHEYESLKQDFKRGHNRFRFVPDLDKLIQSHGACQAREKAIAKRDYYWTSFMRKVERDQVGATGKALLEYLGKGGQIQLAIRMGKMELREWRDYPETVQQGLELQFEAAGEEEFWKRLKPMEERSPLSNFEKLQKGLLLGFSDVLTTAPAEIVWYRSEGKPDFRKLSQVLIEADFDIRNREEWVDGELTPQIVEFQTIYTKNHGGGSYEEMGGKTYTFDKQVEASFKIHIPGQAVWEFECVGVAGSSKEYGDENNQVVDGALESAGRQAGKALLEDGPNRKCLPSPENQPQ